MQNNHKESENSPHGPVFSSNTVGYVWKVVWTFQKRLLLLLHFYLNMTFLRGAHRRLQLWDQSFCESLLLTAFFFFVEPVIDEETARCHKQTHYDYHASKLTPSCDQRAHFIKLTRKC